MAKMEANLKQWKRDLKADMRHEKMARREERKAAHQGWKNQPFQNQPWRNCPWQDNPGMGAGVGFFLFLMGLVIAGLTALLVIAILTIVRSHAILGYAIPLGYSLWVPIVFVCAIYFLVITPFKFMMKNARPRPWSNYSFFNDVMMSIFFVFALYVAIFLGRELFPIVNAAYGIVVGYLKTIHI